MFLNFLCFIVFFAFLDQENKDIKSIEAHALRRSSLKLDGFFF